jgi:hypothetical protein
MIELSCVRVADEHLGLLKHSRCIQAVSTSSHPLLCALARWSTMFDGNQKWQRADKKLHAGEYIAVWTSRDDTRRLQALAGQFMSAGAHTLGQKVYSHQQAARAMQVKVDIRLKIEGTRSAALLWLLLQIWLARWLARWKVCKRRERCNLLKLTYRV